VEVELVSAPLAVGAEPSFETDLGFEVRLDSAFWTITELELLACASAFQRLWSAVVPAAHAHGVSTPTLLSAPTVETASATESVVIGRLEPPSGRYCGLRQALGPADDDAVGLAAAPHMIGQSFELSGAFRAPGEQYVEFTVSTAATLDRELTLSEVELTRSSSRATLRLERDASRWFDGIEFARDDALVRAQRLLENMADSLRVSVE